MRPLAWLLYTKFATTSYINTNDSFPFHSIKKSFNLNHETDGDGVDDDLDADDDNDGIPDDEDEDDDGDGIDDEDDLEGTWALSVWILH